jgi:signal peptidase II
VIELFASAALFFVLDRLSKSLIEVRVGGRAIALGPLLRLKRVASVRRHYNSDTTRVLLVAVWVFALVSAITLFQLGTVFHNRAQLIALGAALGGAAGNLADILRTRSVSDFIDFKFWPAFNFADVAIVVGLVVAFWTIA